MIKARAKKGLHIKTISFYMYDRYAAKSWVTDYSGLPFEFQLDGSFLKKNNKQSWFNIAQKKYK